MVNSYILSSHASTISTLLENAIASHTRIDDPDALDYVKSYVTFTVDGLKDEGRRLVDAMNDFGFILVKVRQSDWQSQQSDKLTTPYPVTENHTRSYFRTRRADDVTTTIILTCYNNPFRNCRMINPT